MTIAEYPTISSNPRVQAFYEHCRGEGTSHALAEIFATRSAPRAETDREYFEGQGNLGEQLDEGEIKRLRANAARDGHAINYTDHYNGALARYPLDPLACVPASGGRGHIKKVCELRGVDCQGIVNYKAPRRDPQPDVKLAEDIVQDRIQETIKRDPAQALKDRRELREEVIHKHSYK